MYLAGISVRRVEDITEALWGTRVSPSTVSNLNKKIYAKIEAWRNRRIEGEHPYLYLDGIVMKRSWAGEVRNVSLLVASAVNAEGFREILGICEGAKEDKSGWSAFLRHLVDRGLKGVQLIMREIRRRTRVVGAFPDGQSCLNLAAARLRCIAGTAWSTKRYMNMQPLYQSQVMQTGAVA